MTPFFRKTILSGFLLLGLSAVGIAQTTTLTYQGKLNDGAAAANGSYDFEFRLYDTGGTQIGSTAVRNGVAVSSGIFTVNLDFGPGFPGDDRFLEIAVRAAGGGGFTILTPRQRVNSSPYAIKSISSDTAGNATTATTASNALQLGGVAANQYVVTTDPRLTDARPPTAGSPNYVQNIASTQAGTTNFNITGNGLAGGLLSGGTINAVSAATGYQIAGIRILSNLGSANLFAGVNAGIANTGSSNSFFGTDAGRDNLAGGSNSFFGKDAGQSNTTGSFNSFFGKDAGQVNTGGNNSFFGANAGDSNTSGLDNSFFGTSAGDANTTGNSNAFFGFEAGLSNTIGSSNSFFGYRAGRLGSGANTSQNSFFGWNAGASNSFGSTNSFFGFLAGSANTTGGSNVFLGAAAGNSSTEGSSNVFIGFSTGNSNVTGDSNTLIGQAANVASGNLDHATAIGAGAVVSNSNSVVLGRPVDTVRISGDLQLSGIATGGTSTLCRNGLTNFVTLCNSSSLRYKTNISRFAGGLDVVKRLQPIAFDWKEGGHHDIGFGAEDVAVIEPLLAVYGQNGEVEGVKYDRIGVVLVNAVKEQQAEISSQRSAISNQQRQIAGQQRQIEALLKANAAISERLRLVEKRLPEKP